MERRPRVLIADDHPLTRSGVRRTLEGRGFTVCAEAPDAASAVEAALRERPEICLLDVHMPGSGVFAAREISRAVPESVVVMLTVSYDDRDLFDALRAGAAGYLLKDMDPERLPDALRGVLGGEAALPRPLVARLVEEFRSHDGRRAFGLGRRGPRLSAREWEVLELMHSGLGTKEIAERLFVSPVTVRRHISSLIAKLGVRDRAAAVELFDDRR